MKTDPEWLLDSMPEYPSLSKDVEADALIIGGGITGITAAYLLAASGKRVMLLEKNQIGSAETLHTTAHISYPTDERLLALEKRFGKDHAQAIWDACHASADEIARLVREEELDCHWTHVPGYLYAAEHGNLEQEKEDLQKEAVLAQSLGFDAQYQKACPVTRRPAIAFANLQKFHPLLYLVGLTAAASTKGAKIYQNSEVTEFSEDSHHVKCNGFTVSFKHVFIATHVPLQGNASSLSAAIFQTKLAGYSTYAVTARIPNKEIPEGLWWDTSDPYFYFRTDHDEDGTLVIAGGEDHKTGQVTNTETCYTQLIQKLHTVFPCAHVERRWSGQVIETPDGLPYIGLTKNQFVATGYSGTGMTFGTLAAMMFRDHVMGIENPWTDLFSPERKKLAATWDYLKENKDYPYYLLKGMLTQPDEELSSIAKGEGIVLRHEGKKVAVHRDEEGRLTRLSAVCPHLGCIVNWNSADHTWDCPCHGSRFTAEGKVMCGPAETALEEIDE